MRRALAVLTVLAVAGCGGATTAAKPPVTVTVTQSPPPPKVFTITGYIDTYPSGLTQRVGSPCDAENGMDDVTAGAAVVVSDPSGAKIAVGQLGPGAYRKVYTCRFPFTVRGVPDKFPLYSIEVSHRGDLTYSRAKLNVPVGLSLQN